VVSVERGWYNELGEPLVTLQLHIADDDYLPIEVLVDTGFNRGLLLFAGEARAARLPPTRSASAKLYLADGSPCSARSTFGYIRWMGELKEIEVLVVEHDRGERDKCLIGMELLKHTDILFGPDDFHIHALLPEGGQAG